MPQMSPMNWLMLFIFFMACFYALVAKLHFLYKAGDFTKAPLGETTRQVMPLSI